MKMKITYIFAVLFVFMSMSANTTYLNLEQLKMNIGGSSSFNFYWDRFGNFDLDINLSPYYGIFLLKNFETYAKLNFQSNLIHSNPRDRAPSILSCGFLLGTKYYFNWKDLIGKEWPIIPYVGFGFGPSMENWWLLSLKLNIEIPLGVLIPLEKNFALDFGIPLYWQISTRSLIEKFHIPVGYFGIKYFF